MHPYSSFRASARRLFLAVPAFAALGLIDLSAAPQDLLPLQSAAKNYTTVFSQVKIGQTTPEANNVKAGKEILIAAYAYLNPTSPVYLNTAYRDRLLILLDHRLGGAAANDPAMIRDIGWSWHAAYAYLLLKTYRPADLSPNRVTTYETGLANNTAAILAENPLLYNDGILGALWLNGDLALAMGAHFGSLALGDAVSAEKARAAIDNVMSKTWLAGGGTRYVGFWGEVPSYHQETVEYLIWWWKLTGSTSIKAVLDNSVPYSPTVNEPSRFVEQSSDIAYKHMYNNRHNAPTSLWKAYLYDDGYNYFFGAIQETSASPELLDTVLYAPNLQTKTPPSHVGVFRDDNIQGPRGRFNGNWGWIANARDVQNGGPEEKTLSDAQGYEGRMCGKNTLVGAFALGPVANNTSLKGAVDGVTLEFKETAGTETDYTRGARYRFLTQDEFTRTIVRKNFGTLASTYTVSKRVSSQATANWDAGKTNFVGQQLWVLTGERIIGLLQISATADTPVYGLDARILFTGGRKTIMGSYLDLAYDTTAGAFSFGDIRAKIQGTTFTGSVTQQRIGIADPASTDDYTALARINDSAVNGDNVFTVTAANSRRWIVLDITRDGVGYATSVVNVLPANASWAVLQFTEGVRKVRIVQNLTSAAHTYTGTFNHGTTYAQTSLHRSWTDTVSPLTITSGSTTVTDTLPAYEHMIAVNSNQPDDHNNSSRTAADILP